MVIDGVQMEGSALEPAADPELLPLTDADVPEMLDLVELTKPGPYLRRTIEMGRYIGLRDGGDASLIAMAGERVRPDGWTEISAVCTDPRYRARGLGTRLVRAVADGMRSARGDVPFLHAAAENVNAIRLYEALGFTLRRRTTFTIVRSEAR
jgi:predicted GNAT family acetyltransferase